MKIIRYFCTVFALLSLTAVCAAASGEYELCTALEVLPETEYNSEDYVTRAELAYIAAAISGTNAENLSYEGEVFYKDVPADHDYAMYINALTRMDMIRGFADKYYEPEYSVSYSDAAYSFVNILGYKKQAELKGGYPNGYTKVAAELGLFKGAQSGKYITQKDMSVILYNTLTAPRNVISIKSDEDTSYYTDDDSTLLEYVFDVTEIEGLISKNSLTSLDGTAPTGEGYVAVNGEIYAADDTLSAMLGYKVTAWVKWEDDDGTIIAAVSDDTGVVKIWDSELEADSTVSTIIADTDDKIRKYDISSDVDYIYNGKFEQNLKETDILTQNGFIELIDNNNDSKYDLISITNYETCFAYGISEANEAVTDKFGDRINLEGKDYKVYINGVESQIGDIQKFDSISYTRTKDDDNYILYVTRDEIISGMITGILDEDNIVVIDDGSEYEISTSYLKHIEDGKAKELTISLEATFYLDIRGRIIGFENMAASERSEAYGFLIKVVGDYEEDGMIAKMLKTDGVLEDIYIAENVTVDGVRYKKDKSFADSIATDGFARCVVRYTLNGDELITKIDTPYNNAAAGEIEGINLTKSFVLENTDGTWYNAGQGMLDGRFYINNSTIVFEIPNDTMKEDLSLYTLKSVSAFSNGGVYQGVEGYDLTNDFTASVVIKYTEGAAELQRGDPMTMVAGFKYVYDEESAEILPVIITVDGAELTARNADMVSDVKKGDIIHYNLDAKKRINAISVILSSSQSDIPTFTNGAENTTSYWRFRGELRYGALFLIEASGNAFIAAELPESDDPSVVYEFTRGGITYKTKQYANTPSRNSVFVYRYSGDVYVYDRAEDEITKSDMTVLSEALYKYNPNARIFVRQGYGTVRQLYVIK